LTPPLAMPTSMKRINDLFLSKVTFILLLCFLTIEISIGQSNALFILEGKCSIQNGIIHLGAIDRSYYPNSEEGYTVKLINGYFKFQAPIKYPYAFRLLIKQKGKLVFVSDMFFVEKGLQTININTGTSGNLPEINNILMKELKIDYANWFQSYYNIETKFNNKRDSLLHVFDNTLPLKVSSALMIAMDDLSSQNDTLLLQYTKKHPGSYVALWKLADKVTNGYKVIFDSILNCFSPNIKTTHTAKVLSEKLSTARVGSIGNRFPDLNISDTKRKILLHVIKENNKYTLIDFWFSSCSPCKAQFQELKRLYKSFSSKGFNIIGISVDSKEDFRNWQNVIYTSNLTWPQYLDIDQTVSRKLSILSYPSNFLLDKEGVIIYKNITLYELGKLLNDNLN